MCLAFTNWDLDYQSYVVGKCCYEQMLVKKLNVDSESVKLEHCILAHSKAVLCLDTCSVMLGFLHKWKNSACFSNFEILC